MQHERGIVGDVPRSFLSTANAALRRQLTYSDRNAVMGSSRVARSAG